MLIFHTATQHSISYSKLTSLDKLLLIYIVPLLLLLLLSLLFELNNEHN